VSLLFVSMSSAAMAQAWSLACKLWRRISTRSSVGAAESCGEAEDTSCRCCCCGRHRLRRPSLGRRPGALAAKRAEVRDRQREASPRAKRARGVTPLPRRFGLHATLLMPAHKAPKRGEGGRSADVPRSQQGSPSFWPSSLERHKCACSTAPPIVPLPACNTNPNTNTTGWYSYLPNLHF
jgi:hypothetical protein